MKVKGRCWTDRTASGPWRAWLPGWLQLAGVQVPAEANLCTPPPPPRPRPTPNPSQVWMAHWCVTGARRWVSQSHRGKWVGNRVWCTWVAVWSCCCLTAPVTDNNHRELWSLIITTVWRRQNGARYVKARWIMARVRKRFRLVVIYIPAPCCNTVGGDCEDAGQEA